MLSRTLVQARERFAAVVASTTLLLFACSDPKFDVGGERGDSSICAGDCADLGTSAGPTDEADAAARRDSGPRLASDDDAAVLVDPQSSLDGDAALDAHVPDTTRGDSGLAPSSEIWKTQLEGRYVLRYRSYAREQTLGSLAVVASVQHSLATIDVDNGGDVTLTLQLCDDQGELTVPGAKTFLRTSRPETQPKRVLRLVYEGGVFRSQGDPSVVGYDEQTPDGCMPGRKLARRDDQPWLRAQCDCPSSPLPPTSLSDCRLRDSDGDGQAGYTIELSGFVRGRDFCRLRDASQIVGGRIAPDRRHTATLMRNIEFFQLDCEGNGCTRANGEACPGVMNIAEFSPLDVDPSGDASCTELMRQVRAGVHFSDNPLLVPPGC